MNKSYEFDRVYAEKLNDGLRSLAKAGINAECALHNLSGVFGDLPTIKASDFKGLSVRDGRDIKSQPSRVASQV